MSPNGVATTRRRKWTRADNLGHYARPVDCRARFWKYVRKGPGCWLWTGSKSKHGYGKFAFSEEPRHEAAHRASWRINRGPIPDGLFVCHRCDVKACVRPDHLFLGTHSDNMCDSVAKKRHKESRKTICSNGHPYAGENVYVRLNGARGCRTCDRERMRAYYLRKRAAESVS